MLHTHINMDGEDSRCTFNLVRVRDAHSTAAAIMLTAAMMKDDVRES